MMENLAWNKNVLFTPLVSTQYKHSWFSNPIVTVPYILLPLFSFVIATSLFVAADLLICGRFFGVA